MAAPDTAFSVACLQVNATPDIAANIADMSRLVREAAAKGAQLIMMPENAVMMDFGRSNIIAKAMPHDTHVALKAFQQLAAELRVWLHCGTLGVTLGNGKLANRTYVLRPDGAIAAQYDKIHMFDVDLGGGESYNESATFQPGTQATFVDLPWGRLGLTVCYDLRFPQLYRHLAQAGTHFLTVPAAFTQKTGEAHWHVLLRARAIETGCYVFAPAQTGTHAGGRKTFGHALIINPWGEVVVDAGTEPGMIMAKVDPAQVVEARGKIPSLRLDAAYRPAAQV